MDRLLDTLDTQQQTQNLVALIKGEPLFLTPQVTAWLEKNPVPPVTIRPALYAYQKSLLTMVRSSLRARKDITPAMLAEAADKYPQFSMIENGKSPAEQEVLALFDSEVNRMVLQDILVGVREGLEQGWINRDVWRKEASSVHERAMDSYMKSYVLPAMTKDLKPLLEGKKGALLYVAIGCGKGEKDILTKQVIETHYPDIRVALYCLDPYQKKDGHNFVAAGGVLDTKPLNHDETLAGRARQQLNEESVVATIAVGHHAFHHIGMSYARFKAYIADADAVYLLETLGEDRLYDTMPLRIRSLSRDVLSNLGFGELYRADWVNSALAEPENNSFLAYYLTDKILQDASPETRVMRIPDTVTSFLMTTHP